MTVSSLLLSLFTPNWWFCKAWSTLSKVTVKLPCTRQTKGALTNGFSFSHRTVVTKPPYEVNESGWGEFEIQIKIFFMDQAERPVSLYSYCGVGTCMQGTYVRTSKSQSKKNNKRKKRKNT